MVINGKYGSGKSTLLGFIEERNAVDNKFDVIKYDAWENNFFENPMIPILYSISKFEKTGSKIKETAKSIVKNIPQAILSSLAGAHNVDLRPLLNNENIFDDYDNYKKAICKFKEALTIRCSDKKTALLVDELDRCLPEYQIKVLEALYYLLDVPNLIVVIALDKDQLETSIQSKFGKDLNSHGYLSKFIQYEIDLPEGDTYNYVVSLMKFQTDECRRRDVLRKLADAFKSIELPVRECVLIVEKLNLLFDDGNKYRYYYPFMAGTLLLLKHINGKVYKKYFSNERDYRNVDTDPISLSETPFSSFWNDIKGTEFEKVIKLWISDNGYGYFFLLHFINLFYPIEQITAQSLGEFFFAEPDSVVSRLNGSDRFDYPSDANQLIKKINMLI